MEKPVNVKCSDPQQLGQLVCVHGSVSHAPTTPTGIIKPQKYWIYKQNRSLFTIMEHSFSKDALKSAFYNQGVFPNITTRGGSSTPANTFGINQDEFFKKGFWTCKCYLDLECCLTTSLIWTFYLSVWPLAVLWPSRMMAASVTSHLQVRGQGLVMHVYDANWQEWVKASVCPSGDKRGNGG